MFKRKSAMEELYFSNFRKEDLDKLFDFWMTTLNIYGCPPKIINFFQEKRKEATENMLKVWENHYPEETILELTRKGIYLGLPVISNSYLGLYGLVGMVRNGYKRGYTDLNPNKIINDRITPSTLYFIYNIKDGRKELVNIFPQKQSFLTAEEGLALCMHTDALIFNKCISFANSFYSNPNKSLGMCLSNGYPQLVWFENDSGGTWKLASRYYGYF